MNKMNKYTPQIIAASKDKVKFSIPLYQRLFAWGDEQIVQLLSDLRDHFNKNSDSNEPYYIGMLTAIKEENGRYSLLDGQQRFTVMMLLGICLKEKEHYKEWGEFATSDRLELVARQQDREFIAAKIDGKDSSTYVNANMQQAIECIDKFMEGIENKQAFAKSIFERLTFFITELPESYQSKPASLNRYFELMNSAGRGLKPHEILKVDLLGRSDKADYHTQIWNTVCDMQRPIIKQSDEESVESYRNRYYNAIGYRTLECLKSGNETADDLSIFKIKPKEKVAANNWSEDREDSIITFEQFLLLVLHLTTDNEEAGYSDYRADKLLEIFENNEDIDIDKFYDNLLYYRLLFDYYVIKRVTNSEQSKYSMLADDNSKKVRQFQSMISVSTDYYRWLPALMRYIDSNEFANDNLLGKLKDIDNNNHPTKDFTTGMSYHEIDRYWFWRLDYYLWEEAMRNQDVEPYIRDYVFRENRSIEHLHPQNQVHNEMWDKSSIHSFGNLAMISTSFNSQQGNDSIEIKFARVESQIRNSSLQSLKLYRMYQDAKKDKNNWTQELAADHQKKMIDILSKSYSKTAEE